MDRLSSIKIYKADLHWWTDFLKFSRSGLTSTPGKVCRVTRTVHEMRGLDQWQFPIFISPTSVDIHGGLGPALSRLPRELRDIIYSYLLSSGQLQFLRVSNALHIEGSALLPEYGIYRMELGHESINYSLPSQRIVDNIRNLEIRADMSYFGVGSWAVDGTPDLRLLEAFGKPGCIRGQCSVYLEVWRLTIKQYLGDFCNGLRLLSDFETVVMRVEVNWREPEFPVQPEERLLGMAAEAWFKHYGFRSGPWPFFKCQFVYDLLLPLTWSLGKAHLEEQDGRGFRVVFHPRKALRESEEA